jgi:hypothetical protein
MLKATPADTRHKTVPWIQIRSYLQMSDRERIRVITFTLCGGDEFCTEIGVFPNRVEKSYVPRAQISNPTHSKETSSVPLRDPFVEHSGSLPNVGQYAEVPSKRVSST